MVCFKYGLESSPTGKEILQILDQSNIGGGPYLEGITYNFLGLRADFEGLPPSPYPECLKDATQIIRLDLKLRCHDSDTGIDYEAWFRPTDDGVQVELPWKGSGEKPEAELRLLLSSDWDSLKSGRPWFEPLI
jgi:hypothetical protein